jgi:hypothetical protein
LEIRAGAERREMGSIRGGCGWKGARGGDMRIDIYRGESERKLVE